MLRKSYSHTIPAPRIRQKYKGGPAAAPTSAPVVGGVTLTTGSVPQNLRCLTAGQSLPGGGVAADGTFVWNPTLATTSLGTLVRYEMRAYMRAATADAKITAGTSKWVCTAANNDHEP